MDDRRFDIYPLAFTLDSDEAKEGFETFINSLPTDDRHPWGLLGQPLIRSIDGQTAAKILTTLDEIGIRTEIRPAAPLPTPPPMTPAVETATTPCPSCGFANPESQPECSACGLVFAKFEKRAVGRMMAESRLEEEINRARRIEQEWTDHASNYRKQHPLPAGATVPFADDLVVEEVPFLRLETDSGPLLLTSKRMLVRTKKELISIPFEMISTLEFGGGFSLLGGNTRMVLTFKAPLVIKRLRASTLTLQVQKNPSFDRETILHWAFSKNFMCGRCGARDLSFRLEKSQPRARCMRCAADHSINLTQAVALPMGDEK